MRLAPGLFIAAILISGAPARVDAQWSTVDHQYYLPAGHNWEFRARFPDADRLFNAFDYGHAILYELLWARKGEALEGSQYDFITRRLLINPPDLPLEESAIAPGYSRLAPEAKAMFEWAHLLHRQVYDVLADVRLNEAQRDAEVQRLLAYYRSRPDLAFSAKPKGMSLMEGQPYSLAFRKEYPKFNGLIWSYHWLQVGLYDALLAGASPDERVTLVTATVARFRQMLDNPPASMPRVMPMTAAVAPLFTRRYPEAAMIFDNLHSLHDVISDVLANDAVPRNRKRAEILVAIGRYRDDSTDVMTPDDWRAMSSSMGIENQGGPATGILTEPPRPTAAVGATMPGHVGHPAPPTDSVSAIADSLPRVSEAAAKQRLVDALFRLLADPGVQRSIAADSSLHRLMVDLVPVVPEEHRDHFRMLLGIPPDNLWKEESATPLPG